MSGRKWGQSVRMWRNKSFSLKTCTFLQHFLCNLCNLRHNYIVQLYKRCCFILTREKKIRFLTRGRRGQRTRHTGWMKRSHCQRNSDSEKWNRVYMVGSVASADHPHPLYGNGFLGRPMGRRAPEIPPSPAPLC